MVRTYMGALLVSAGVLIGLPVARAETSIVGSRVDSATVFPSAVSVHRTTHVTVPAGEHTVVFAPLPASLDDDSVRIGGFGPAAMADGVAVRVGRRGELMVAAIEALEERLEALQREQVAVTARCNTPGIPAAEARTLRARLDTLVARVRIASAELNAATNLAQEPAKFVSVSVTTERAGELDLSIEYLVLNGAHWASSYAAHLDDTQGRVGLDVFATLQQNTGEDWDGVRVSVSTVVPPSGLSLPELAQAELYLEEQGDYDERATARTEGRHGSAVGAPTPAPSILPPAYSSAGGMDGTARIVMSEGEVRSQALAARIDLPAVVSLRSGATPRRVLAAHLGVDAALEYQAVPSLSNSVFLISRFDNPASFPLLAGRVALFVNDQYVGATALSDVPIEESVTLPFGVDAGLTVERTAADQRLARHGACDQTTVRYQFRLANHRARAARITVLDRIPVAQTHGLAVRMLPGSQAPEAREDRDAPGLVRWAFNVDPGATTRWDFAYVVDMPRGRTLSGELP